MVGRSGIVGSRACCGRDVARPASVCSATNNWSRTPSRWRPRTRSPPIRAAAARCSRGSTRARRGSRRRTSSCPRSRAPIRSRSPRKTGCATTTTSSRIRSAKSARICRGSSTSSCRSSRTGPYDGYPRVYLIARELIAHTAGRFDLETLVDFTAAYQRAAPLSIGETWAIPIMLRLGLVEELRRLVDGVVAARHSREQARKWEAALGERRRRAGAGPRSAAAAPKSRPTAGCPRHSSWS